MGAGMGYWRATGHPCSYSHISALLKRIPENVELVLVKYTLRVWSSC